MSKKASCYCCWLCSCSCRCCLQTEVGPVPVTTAKLFKGASKLCSHSCDRNTKMSANKCSCLNMLCASCQASEHRKLSLPTKPRRRRGRRRHEATTYNVITSPLSISLSLAVSQALFSSSFSNKQMLKSQIHCCSPFGRARADRHTFVANFWWHPTTTALLYLLVASIINVTLISEGKCLVCERVRLCCFCE